MQTVRVAPWRRRSRMGRSAAPLRSVYLSAYDHQPELLPRSDRHRGRHVRRGHRAGAEHRRAGIANRVSGFASQEQAATVLGMPQQRSVRSCAIEARCDAAVAPLPRAGDDQRRMAGLPTPRRDPSRRGTQTTSSAMSSDAGSHEAFPTGTSRHRPRHLDRIRGTWPRSGDDVHQRQRPKNIDYLLEHRQDRILDHKIALQDKNRADVRLEKELEKADDDKRAEAEALDEPVWRIRTSRSTVYRR